MADIKDALKTEAKSGRRASFARALHVPAIARRVRQFDSGSEIVRPTTAPPRPNQAIGNEAAKEAIAASAAASEATTPGRIQKYQTASKPGTASVETHEVSDVDQEGADIPDIPLRRHSNNKRLSGEVSMTSLAALERLLAAGGSPDYQQGGHLDSNFYRSRNEKRYDAQSVASEAPNSLYTLSECSWESSLPGVPEGHEPSLRRDANSAPSLYRPRQEMLEIASLPLRQDAVSNAHAETPIVSAIPPRQSSPVLGDFESRLTSSAPSITTTSAPTEAYTLPPLQAKGTDDSDALNPVAEDEMGPGNFDLVVPSTKTSVYSLEHRSELLFSVNHLRVILDDPIFLHRFATFVGLYRPQSTSLLNYTLDALKAIRGMEWVNAIISQNLCLESPKHPQQQHELALSGRPELMENESLRQKTTAAIEALARDELPAYITHVWTDVVEMSMRRKITGTMPAHLQTMSEGLAEVFCVSDPSRPDNPIVFASEEFHRTTQYGPDYVLGRNCRFLQGPKTNPFSVQRIHDKLKQGQEHYETFLNYRRDGLPFMNLLMCTPLLDSKGQVRYFLGAQIDVSGLAKDCSGLESLRRLVDQDDESQRKNNMEDNDSSHTATNRNNNADVDKGATGPPVGTATTTSSAWDPKSGEEKDKFRLVAEMLNRNELETVRRFGGRMHRSQQEQVKHLEAMSNWHKPRVVLQELEHELSPPSSPQHQQYGRPEITDANGNISISCRGPASVLSQSGSTASVGAKPPAIFENYLVVRPYPSMRILFASPSLRVPGILQSHLMSRIGGSRRIHDELESAFSLGQSVTAKVKWISGSGLRNANNNGVIPDSSSGSTGSSHKDSGATIGMEGRPRWIHCTPLLSSNGSVGVWVVVIVDDDPESTAAAAARRKRDGSLYPPSGRAVVPRKTRDRFGAQDRSDFAAYHHHLHHHALPDDDDDDDEDDEELRRRQHHESRVGRGATAARRGRTPEEVVRFVATGTMFGGGGGDDDKDRSDSPDTLRIDDVAPVMGTQLQPPPRRF